LHPGPELSRQMGEACHAFQALAQLQIHYFTRADYRTALEMAEELLGVAERTEDPKDLLQAHRAVGQSLHLMDYFRRLRFTWSELFPSMTRANPSPAARWGYDLGVRDANLLGRNLWHSVIRIRPEAVPEAVEMAQKLRNPFS